MYDIREAQEVFVEAHSLLFLGQNSTIYQPCNASTEPLIYAAKSLIRVHVD